jgi:hypothetical protein
VQRNAIVTHEELRTADDRRKFPNGCAPSEIRSSARLTDLGAHGNLLWATDNNNRNLDAPIVERYPSILRRTPPFRRPDAPRCKNYIAARRGQRCPHLHRKLLGWRGKKAKLASIAPRATVIAEESEIALNIVQVHRTFFAPMIQPTQPSRTKPDPKRNPCEPHEERRPSGSLEGVHPIKTLGAKSSRQPP